MDTGWLNLTSYSDNASVGTDAWQNPGNAATENGISTNTNTILGLTTHYLIGLQLVSPPANLAGSTIMGVEVQFKRMYTSTLAPTVTDNIVSLVVGGSVVGSNRATATAWPKNTLTFEDHGSSSDLWGLSLTSANVLASNFGVAISGSRSFTSAVWNIDVVQMKITYVLPSSTTFFLLF